MNIPVASESDTCRGSVDLDVSQGWVEDGEDLHLDRKAEISAYCNGRERYEAYDDFDGTWTLDAMSRYTNTSLYKMKGFDFHDVEVDGHETRILSYALDNGDGDTAHWVRAETVMDELFAEVSFEVRPADAYSGAIKDEIDAIVTSIHWKVEVD